MFPHPQARDRDQLPLFLFCIYIPFIQTNKQLKKKEIKMDNLCFVFKNVGFKHSACVYHY